MSSVNPFLSDSEEESDQKRTRSRRPGGPGREEEPPSMACAAVGIASMPSLPLPPPEEEVAVSGPGGARAAGGEALVSGLEPSRVPLDTIAAQLLRDQYILSALELHTELLEAGRELPRLRDYFSNPGNFERHMYTPPKDLAPAAGQLNRAGSISTLDSLDFARYSDDGNRETDERVAVLEFELRKAKETIQSLRANLTQAAAFTESDVPLQDRKNYKCSPEIQEPIKPLEKRALNFLVNEYLLKINYKLTAITFSDENDDQDFELWDDVGLNIPKPPDLLQLYRECGSHVTLSKRMVDVSVGVEPGELDTRPDAKELNALMQQPQLQEIGIVHELQEQLSILNNEKRSLAAQIEHLKSEIEILKHQNFAAPVASDSMKPPTNMIEQMPHSGPVESGEYLDIRSFENNIWDVERERTSTSSPRDSETGSCSPAVPAIQVTTLTSHYKEKT